MLTFLFWNLNRKPLEYVVSRLAQANDVDLVILVECPSDASVVLLALNDQPEPRYFFAPSIGCDRVRIFARFPAEFLHPVEEAAWWTIRRLELPGTPPALLAATHLISKLRYTPSDQIDAANELSQAIRRAEDVVGHSRTMVVGDLNMDPFEEGVVSAAGLHAISSRRVAARRIRTVRSRTYPFFYNPMWNHLGEATRGSPGTFYYNDSSIAVLFWHAFDQLLVRPDLLACLADEDISILDNDGARSFLTEGGIPNSSDFSDHLPLLFRLSL